MFFNLSSQKDFQRNRNGKRKQYERVQPRLLSRLSSVTVLSQMCDRTTTVLSAQHTRVTEGDR